MKSIPKRNSRRQVAGAAHEHLGQVLGTLRIARNGSIDVPNGAVGLGKICLAGPVQRVDPLRRNKESEEERGVGPIRKQIFG